MAKTSERRGKLILHVDTETGEAWEEDPELTAWLAQDTSGDARCVGCDSFPADPCQPGCFTLTETEEEEEARIDAVIEQRNFWGF